MKPARSIAALFGLGALAEARRQAAEAEARAAQLAARVEDLKEGMRAANKRWLAARPLRVLYRHTYAKQHSEEVTATTRLYPGEAIVVIRESDAPATNWRSVLDVPRDIGDINYAEARFRLLADEARRRARSDEAAANRWLADLEAAIAAAREELP